MPQVQGQGPDKDLTWQLFKLPNFQKFDKFFRDFSRLRQFTGRALRPFAGLAQYEPKGNATLFQCLDLIHYGILLFFGHIPA